MPDPHRTRSSREFLLPAAVVGKAGSTPIIRRLLLLSWQYRWGCVAVLAFQLALLALGLSGIRLSGLGVDVARRAVDPAAPPLRWPFGIAPPNGLSTIGLLTIVGGLVLGFAALRAVLNYSYALAVGRLVHIHLVPDVRAGVFDKLQRLSFRFFDEHASGSIINRVTGDVQSLRSFVDGVLIQGVIMVLSLAVYLTYMLRSHVGLTLACLVFTPVIGVATTWFSRWARPAYRRSRELADDVVLAMSEGVQGIQVTKVFGREEYELERFRRKGTAVLEQQHEIFRRVSRFGPTIQFITQLDVGILLIYGGHLVSHDVLSLGELIVFAGLLQQFSGQISSMTGIVNTLQQSLIGARRVFEVLDAPLEIRSPPNPTPLGKARGHLRFEHVDFSYGGASARAGSGDGGANRSDGAASARGEAGGGAARVRGGASDFGGSGREGTGEILEDIDFEVSPGQCVAVLGVTGAGKSTLLSLIPRFFDATAGRVMIDGIDVRDLEIDELRKSVGLVFQESLLFRTTVAANIAFGHPDASREAIERAARLAAAHEFICNLPNGYDTVLQESGVDLSGGQRQRIAIARALLLEPPLLLLDDPTTAVDPETEDEVLSAMAGAMQGRTTLVVANRLSTLRRANFIVVLHHGRIVERGTHDELMRLRGFYFRAASLQTIDDSAMHIADDAAAGATHDTGARGTDDTGARGADDTGARSDDREVPR